MKVVKSLREEIYSIISDHILEDFEKHDNNNWTVEQITNEVIEKIEKRIDSCLEEQSKYHEDYAEGLHRLRKMLSK